MKPSRQPQYCAAIIERSDNAFLIVQQDSSGPSPKWMFPRGLARPDESAEAAMRRIAQEQLNVFVELVVGQPPLPTIIDGVPSEVRYFFCGIIGGRPSQGTFAQIRWVTRTELKDLELDDTSRTVTEWLLMG